MERMSTVLKTFINERGIDKELNFIQTGFPKLDDFIGGLRKGSLSVIGSRPAFGKTSLALQIAFNASKNSTGVIYWNLEANAPELFLKVAAQNESIDIKSIYKEIDSKDELEKLKNFVQKIEDLNLFCEDSVSTLDGFIKKFEVINKNNPISLVVIDYLQLISNVETKENTVFINDSLIRVKEFAKENNIAVLILTQLPRQIDDRANKRPRLSDLDSNPGFKDFADLLLFIYRDDVYYPKSQEKGFAEMIVEKNKNGETGMMKFKFIREYMRFEEM